MRNMDGGDLRGSVQTTFRTPSVDDLTEDVPLTTLEYITQVGAWIPVDRYGDTDLDPEQAFTYNLGMIAFLGSDIEMTVDYWSYDFEDVIGGLPQDTLANFYADPEKRDSVKQSRRRRDSCWGSATQARNNRVHGCAKGR